MKKVSVVGTIAKIGDGLRVEELRPIWIVAGHVFRRPVIRPHPEGQVFPYPSYYQYVASR